MNDLDDRMKINLYRVLCPDVLILGEYQMGLLAAKQNSEIELHLRGCPHCQRELAELAAFMDTVNPDLESKFSGDSKLKTILARWLSSSTAEGEQGRLDLAYGSVRGDEDTSLLFEAEEWQIAIEIQDDVEQPGTKTLLGMVIGDLSSEWQAQLWQGDQKIATCVIDAVGNFRFTQLGSKTYVLILSTKGQEIYIPPLEMSGSH